MALGIEGIVRRIEWLEKAIRDLLRRLAALGDAIDRLKMQMADGGGEPPPVIVLVKPNATVAAATMDGTTIVPTPGTGKLIMRPAPAGHPTLDPGALVRSSQDVDFDNIDPSASIPGAARYVVCVINGTRLEAIVWECDPS